MTEVLDININTQENINVYLPEEVSCGTIEAYFGESAELTLDVSLKYIKSGQQAIQDYVNTQINPTFYKYIDEAKEAAKNADADADNAAESAGLAYQSEVKAKESELKATQEANASAESAYQSQQSALASYEYASNADEDAKNALETLGHVLESEERARIWADGNDTEVKPLGGTHSSMVSAGLSYAYANAEEDVPVEEWATTHELIVQGEKGDKGEPGETPDISNLATKSELEEKQDKEKFLYVVDDTPFDLQTNTNYTADELTSLEFHLPAVLSQDFICSLAFSSGATPTQLIVIDDIKWTGDDIVDYAFVPIANKRYNVIIWWDGVFVNGVVRGV